MQDIYKILNRIKGWFDISTDAELADLLGVKQNTISSWRSRGSIPYKKIIAFCKKHDINKDHFFEDEPKEETSSLSSEISDLAQILSDLKNKDLTRFNLMKSLLNDYREILNCSHSKEIPLYTHEILGGRPNLSIASPEPKCFCCKEKLIHFEFHSEEGEKAQFVLICKNCNANDEEQVRRYKADMKKQNGEVVVLPQYYDNKAYNYNI